MNVIIFSGLPGAGKTEQAKEIERRNPERTTIISPGDIYREIEETGPLHRLWNIAGPYIPDVQKGNLVPEYVTRQIVEERIEEEKAKGVDTFVFTGFPRTVKQQEMFDDYLDYVRFVGEEVNEIHIDLAVLPRLAERRIADRPDEEKKRSDDEIETATHRIYEVYKEPGKTSDMLHKLAREKRLVVIRGDESRSLENAYQQGLITFEEKKELGIKEVRRRIQEKLNFRHGRERE